MPIDYKKKDNTSVNPHKDYVMFQLMSLLKSQLFALVGYMQKITPYGDAYKKAYDKYKELLKEFDVFAGLLQDCVDALPEVD